ncbi:MAG: nucleotidyltransferase substrate binding protein [Leptospiraceae bacterium]|nr:nucleotidyltransferase substrate binding protein [Leptospiraceae bacterium]MCZ8347786.1 nucleotidyltransferase substrate binding protein [Leptospiraceae bacterium]
MESIRYKQRFQNFSKALSQLTKFIQKAELNEPEKQGLIKAFEYNYELAWNLLKDYYQFQGDSGIQGSRDAIQIAYQRNLITNGDIWMQMIQSRNLTSHVYNPEIMEEIVKAIVHSYYKEFHTLKEKFESL